MSSATEEKVKGKAGAPGKNEPKSRRPNPVALEAPVSVAGARPVSAKDKRELFTEDTTTVLVFKDGAVIQLSAAITVGQLLFLTDKRSKREVVCQVVHKRSHRPTNCYVELEFTEEVENFWGVSFPEQEEAEQIPPTAQAVEAEETTEDDRSEPVAAPKTEDVAQLKSEVEMLRAQLRELQEKKSDEEKKLTEERETQARRLAEAEAAARAAAESDARERAERLEKEAQGRATRLAEEARQRLQSQEESADPLVRAELAARAAAEEEARQKLLEKDEEARRASEEARKWEQDAIEKERERKRLEQERKEREQAELEKAEREKEERSRAPLIGMKLPSAAPVEAAETPKTVVAPAGPAAKEEIDPLEDLLPKPALDFSRAPKGLDPNDPYNIYKPLRKKAGWMEIVAAGILVVLLIGGGGLAWYKNWLPFLHHRVPELPTLPKDAPAEKPAAAPVAAKGTAPVNGAGNPVGASAQPANGSTTGAASNGTGGAPATGESNPEVGAAAKSVESSEPSAGEKASEKKNTETRASTKKESSAKGTGAKGAKNHGKAETSAESKPKPAEAVVESDAPVIPAKVLHAVPPIYPPDAMRNYITGDVRIEAVVDKTGHVGAMQILIGPAALRQAAMDALKQYEYEPATQGGKAVASKVMVTVKFWFDP